MQEHPFIRFVPYRIVAGLAAVAFTGLYTVSLIEYSKLPVWPAAAESIAGAALLSVAGFWAWYVTGVLRGAYLQAALAVTAAAFSVAASVAVEQAFVPFGWSRFACTLPFRGTYCLGGWIILLQWYRIYRTTGREETGGAPPAAVPAVFPQSSPAPISVKDGARIYLVQPDEVLYIEACGDYVTLFTATAQYLKEQTMKQLEEQLAPAGFVRIHRSVLVNTAAILRIELFGKETYRIRLKNQVSVRASSSGYKLLKERLAL